MINLCDENKKFIVTGKQLNEVFFNTYWGITNFKKFVETLKGYYSSKIWREFRRIIFKRTMEV